MPTPTSKNRVTLLKTGMNPTMVSSRPAQSLTPAQFPLLQNVRSRFGVLEARKSETSWSFTGLPASPEIVGAWSGTWYGTEWVILAVRNGTDVDLYDSSDGHAYIKIGQSGTGTNLYPSTALDYGYCIQNGVTFQAVNDPVLTECVLISDGLSVLVWSPNLTLPTAYHVRRVTPFNPTGGYAKDCTITGDLGGYLYDGTSVGLVTGSTSGGTFTYSTPAPIQIVVAATQANNHSLTLTFSTPIDVVVGKQFAMLLSTSDANCDIFRNCKVELYVTGTPFLIHDPTGTDYNECSLDTFSDPNIGTAAAPKSMQLYVWGIQNDTISGMISKVVFTYKGATNRYPTVTTLELLAAGISGNGVSGIPNYAVSYFDSGTGVESAAVVLNSEKASGRQLTYLTTTGTKNFSFPLSYSLRLNWSVKVTPTVAPSNYNGILLYRKDPGSLSYLFTSSTVTSLWTGHGGLPPDTWTAYGTNIIVDTTDETGVNPERPAPSAYNTYPIGFTCAAFANNRFFYGRRGQYQFSEYRFPMRFSLGVRLDDESHTAGGFKFANENPQAFAPLIGDLNLDRLAMFTDRGTYAIAGFDAFSLMRPSRISQFGTSSPKSVVTRRDTIFMLDDARHLRSIPERSNLESRSFDVKDILDSIPSPTSLAYGVSKAWGTVYDDRYHLFYCNGGDTSNKYSFVVDLISGTLVQDAYSVGIACTFMFGGKLVLIKTDGTAAQLESGTSDVTVSVTSREISTDGDFWLMERQRVYADALAGKSLAMSWSAFPQGNSTASSIPLDPVSSSVRIDVSTALGKGLSGRSIQAGFSGAIPGGKKIYEWEFETEGRVSRGTV